MENKRNLSNIHHYFFPNVCHVCKLYGEDVKLKRCANCCMIYYCSKEHQKYDWQQHKEFCKVMRDVLKIYGLPNVDKYISTEDWFQIKIKLRQSVINKIGRELKSDEQEMIFYQRACLVCHRQVNLKNCQKCVSISFCTDHKNDAAHECDSLKWCFELDTSAMYNESAQITFEQVSDKIPFQNMNDFINIFLNSYYDADVPHNVCDAVRSQHLTRPLSVFYAMQLSTHFLKRERLVIHILAANIRDTLTSRSWEILLHLVPTLKSIKIVLVGRHTHKYEIINMLCRECISKKKKISFELRKMWYKVYARSTSFTKPDLIVKYNQMYDEEYKFMWKKHLTAQFLSQLKCLYIVLFYLQEESDKELNLLSNNLKNKMKVIYHGKNPFLSIRPYRNLKTTSICYENNYVTVCDIGY